MDANCGAEAACGADAGCSAGAVSGAAAVLSGSESFLPAEGAPRLQSESSLQAPSMPCCGAML